MTRAKRRIREHRIRIDIFGFELVMRERDFKSFCGVFFDAIASMEIVDDSTPLTIPEDFDAAVQEILSGHKPN